MPYQYANSPKEVLRLFATQQIRNPTHPAHAIKPHLNHDSIPGVQHPQAIRAFAKNVHCFPVRVNRDVFFKGFEGAVIGD
jgi:hypothetical protein